MTQPEVSFSFSIRIKIKRASVSLLLCTGFVLPAQDVSIGRQRHVGSRHTCPSYAYMCRDDGGGGGIDVFIRNAPCAFNYIIYPIFLQCYVMGRFGHENGPFWMLAGAVLVLFFSSIGPVLVGAVLICVGRFRPSLGPFWRWAVLAGSP